MRLKGLLDEDFINYKNPAMYIAAPFCDFKCDREANCKICQNSNLATLPIIHIDNDKLIKRYLDNPITNSIVVCGLEPMYYSWFFSDLIPFIELLRNEYHCGDTIIIYTGYNKEEVLENIQTLQKFDNIIIKFGRYVQNSAKVYDEILGVTLASSNQYAEIIS